MKVAALVLLGILLIPGFYSYYRFNPTNPYNKGCFTYPYGSCDLEMGILLEDLRHGMQDYHYERYHYKSLAGYYPLRRVRAI